jgi:hypothetical protein
MSGTVQYAAGGTNVVSEYKNEIVKIKGYMISKIVALMILFLVLATATVYSQSAFATNANVIKGGTPCAHSGDVGQHKPVTMTTMTIFVCND